MQQTGNEQSPQLFLNGFLTDAGGSGWTGSAAVAILRCRSGSVMVWHSLLSSSLPSSSSSSLNAHVKYLTEYEKGCCCSALSISPCCCNSCCCCRRFCFLFGLLLLPLARGGRGKHTCMISSLSPVWLRPSGFIRKTILRRAITFTVWNCGRDFNTFHWLRHSFNGSCCAVAVVAVLVLSLLLPFLVAKRPAFNEVGFVGFVAATAAACVRLLQLLFLSWNVGSCCTRADVRWLGNGVSSYTTGNFIRVTVENLFPRPFRFRFLGGGSSFARVFWRRRNFLFSARTLFAIA